jgi:hypothetical protein
VGAVSFTYLTKPTNESLGQQLAKDAPLGTQTVIEKSINNLSTYEDYVCFKIATIPIEKAGADGKYFGFVHKWYPIR